MLGIFSLPELILQFSVIVIKTFDTGFSPWSKFLPINYTIDFVILHFCVETVSLMNMLRNYFIIVMYTETQKKDSFLMQFSITTTSIYYKKALHQEVH
jgi:hypothetical protein